MRGRPITVGELKAYLLNLPDDYVLPKDLRKQIKQNKQNTSPEKRREEKFWAKVNKEPGQGPNGDCWEWLGHSRGNGYGGVTYKGKKTKIASRISFELTNPGVELEGFCVCHTCDNPPCCNPAHLVKGTRKDNTQDMIAKGRSTRKDKGPSGTSWCYGCEDYLPYFYFSKNKNRYNGCVHLCKKCMKERSKNPDVIKTKELKSIINEIIVMNKVSSILKSENYLKLDENAQNEVLSFFIDRARANIEVETQKPATKCDEDATKPIKPAPPEQATYRKYEDLLDMSELKKLADEITPKVFGPGKDDYGRFPRPPFEITCESIPWPPKESSHLPYPKDC